MRTDEGVVVDKPVRLEGAQAGVDARGRTGAAESVVRAPGGFERGYGFDVRVPDVVIDGFSIHAAKWHAGIWLKPEGAGTEIAHGVFRTKKASGRRATGRR